MISCYKFQSNNDTIQISEQEVTQVVPFFGHMTHSEVEPINDYEVVYSVFQPVDLPIGVAEGYRLHVREEGDYFLEVFLDGNILRYRYGDPNRLRLQIKKRRTSGLSMEFTLFSIRFKKNQTSFYLCDRCIRTRHI